MRRATAKALDLADVYRFFNRATGVHFYTADAAERAHVLATWPQFADEGAVWRALRTADGATRSRCGDSSTGIPARISTRPTQPSGSASSPTWPQFADEGAAFHAYLSDAFDRAPVHRFYNTQTRTHFYTAQDAERDFVQRTFPQFAYEGVAYYAVGLAAGAGAAAKRDAFRLVDQATFGATPADVDRALAIGAAAWVDEQLAKPASRLSGERRSGYQSLDEIDNCTFGAASESRGLSMRDRPAHAVQAAHAVLHQRAARSPTSSASASRGRCRRSSSCPG